MAFPEAKGARGGMLCVEARACAPAHGAWPRAGRRAPALRALGPAAQRLGAGRSATSARRAVAAAAARREPLQEGSEALETLLGALEPLGTDEAGRMARMRALLAAAPDAIIEKWEHSYEQYRERRARDGAAASGDSGEGSHVVLSEGDFAAESIDQGARCRLHEFLDSEGVVDAMALRLLVFAGVSQWECASSLRLSLDDFVGRVRATSTSGEKCVLTFKLAREDRLEPAYRSARVRQVWALGNVTGEPADGPESTCVCASTPPEAVLAAQLNALQRYDIERVFLFASPQNKAVTGPLPRFAEMLQQEPQFSPLLAHAHAKQLRQVLIDNDRLLVLVGVASARGSRHVYSWTLRRQQGGWLDGVSLECYKGERAGARRTHSSK